MTDNYRARLAEAGVIALKRGEEAWGCDGCDVVGPREGMAQLGGDRETDWGMVAYPTVCEVCHWEDRKHYSSEKEPDLEDIEWYFENPE